MDISYLRNKIAKSKHADWFNTVKINIYFNIEKQQKYFEGLPALFEFAERQHEGWIRKEGSPPDELLRSINYFKKVLKDLLVFVTHYGSQSYFTYNLEEYFNSENFIDILGEAKSVFFYDSPVVDFLIGVYENKIDNYKGAYNYITDNNSYKNIRSKDDFTGYMLAYEFESKDFTELSERKSKEEKSITTLRNDFQNFLNSADKHKEEKEKLFEDWFINTKGNHEKFSNTCDARIEELEKTYKEKLKLEEPAKYWEDRGKKLKVQGWIFLSILVVLVLVVAESLRGILWNPPEEIIKSFFGEDKSTAIRWSIIYITFISFMAFAIKVVSKAMFSSFHLARDSEERHTLTYFYLSLLKDSSVTTDNEKELIMQSLFSRAETGLLKDDSSPAMPNDIAGKIFNKT